MMNIFLLSIYESNLNKPEKEYLLILMEMLYNKRENLKQFESHYKSSGQVVRINAMDKFIQKPIANGRNHDTKMANQIYDFINTPMSHEDEMKKNPDLIEQRKEFRRKMKKYAKPGNHVNVNELEADQYAANKVGTETMIRALHSMNKLDKVYAEIDIRNATENEKNSEAYKKLSSDKARKKYIDDFQKKMRLHYDKLHKKHMKETEIRARALNDKSVSAAVRRSLSD